MSITHGGTAARAAEQSLCKAPAISAEGRPEPCHCWLWGAADRPEWGAEFQRHSSGNAVAVPRGLGSPPPGVFLEGIPTPADKLQGVEETASDTLEFVTHQQVGEPSARYFCLIVMAGPNKGATYRLTTGTHIIGRTEDCDITLAGRGVSRTHASVTVKPHGDVIVEDLRSTNGVYLEGQKLVEPRQMEAGQTIGLGPEVRLRLELSAGSVQSLLQEMYESATTDSLTGLFTRRGFEERLEVEFAMVRRHRISSCLAVIDIDRFKSVNDREGHDAGDLVLQALANQLKASVRAGDLACRWGGEEFTLYVRQTPLIGGVTLMERLRQQLSETDITLPAGHAIRVTFSAGVVDLLEYEDWRTAFRRADEALYQAKRDGRNRIVHYSPQG